MNYKVLYRKYRPSDFDNIVGQEYTVEMLKNAIITGKNAHAYIFTGPRGTGKTSSAKVFAKALNCENPKNGNPCNECASCLSFKDSPDIIEIDAASNNGVAEIRELINNVKLVPTNSKFKIYIIDEVHMLTESAFNALLLTLEEPPSHVIFILATTDIQKVPITILSRCQRFDFKPINKSVIINRLNFVCKEEEIPITDEALEEIALISAGGMRDALGMLDQLSNGENITLEVVSSYFGSVSVKKIDELLTCIEENNTDEMLNILNIVKESGTNYAVFIEKLINELRKIAIEIKIGKTKHDFYFDDIYSMILDLNECLSNVNINVDPYILIELVLLKYIRRDNCSNIENIDNNNLEKNGKLGNNLVQEAILGNNTINSQHSVVGNINSDKNEDNECIKEDKTKVINKLKINPEIRINNCFVDAAKEIKNSISSSWVDFMNFLMKKDRNLISLLADTIVLAASKSYILIQSKIESTNELINENVFNLEKMYLEFSGLKYKFAAINENLWKKEAEKYRFNLKNKIKYNYIEENLEASDDVEDKSIEVDELELIAKDIFGTFDVEN